MAELISCTCGGELTVRQDFTNDETGASIYCEHCEKICCSECSHQCESPSHVKNNLGCEACMIYSKDLSMWFCCEECRQDAIDPYGYLGQAEKDKLNMSQAVLEVCKLIDEALSSSSVDLAKFAEVKLFLIKATEMFLLGKE